MALAWSIVGIENPVHLLFIAAVALIVLGPKRLPTLARALGQGIREFRERRSERGAGEPPSEPPTAVRAGASRADAVRSPAELADRLPSERTRRGARCR